MKCRGEMREREGKEGHRCTVTDSNDSLSERTEGGRHHELPKGTLTSPKLNQWSTAAAEIHFAMVL